MLNRDDCHDYLLFRFNNLIVAIANVTKHKDTTISLSSIPIVCI